jgi:Janus kinase 2
MPLIFYSKTAPTQRSLSSVTHTDSFSPHRNQPETLKITNDSDQWLLHTADAPLVYDELINLVHHIPDRPKTLLRIAPTEYDKPPLLLLCLPPQALIAKKTVIDLSELNSLKPRIISASEDLLLFKDSQHEEESGCFTRMRGEWKLPDDKKLEVTLKILKAQKIEKHLLDFMSLTDKWCKLDSNEIVRMYGVTLQQPIGMVMESVNLGPLDVFLRERSRDQVGFVCLVDAAYTLVRALHYLQERKIIHGRIRCSALQVAKFGPPNYLVVKLGDPGFARPLTKGDIPWIPVEYFDHLEGAKKEMKAEIWAAATTMWEIFSRGARIDWIQRPKEYFAHGIRLPPPEELKANNQEDLYGIMREGWDADPDKRFSPQLIFARLIGASEC